MTDRQPKYRVRRMKDGRWGIWKRQNPLLVFLSDKVWVRVSVRHNWSSAMKQACCLDYYDRLGGISHRKADRR